MAAERRRLIVLLGVLAVAMAIGAYQYWPRSPVNAPARTGARGQTARGAAASTAVEAPDVHLDALSAERPRPGTTGQRDLFRFKPKAPPPAPEAPRNATMQPPAPAAPPGPPPLPPIAMRFIGLVEATDPAKKIAILTDGRGLYEGSEGDIIEGRYRILRIGVESVDIAYLDGRGRQTIRLSGT
jgi:hypothetical protein